MRPSELNSASGFQPSMTNPARLREFAPTYKQLLLSRSVSMPKLSSAKRRGQIALLLTAAIIPLVGIVGLVTDIGYMHYVQRSAQKAADAAVLAAIARYNSTVAGTIFNCPAGSGDAAWPCNNPTPYQCPGG